MRRLNTTPPIGLSTGTTVQPGGLVETELGTCTLNFLFDGSDGRRYIATAGHCILGEDAPDGQPLEKTWNAGEGPGPRTGMAGASASSPMRCMRSRKISP
jgi:hypothetical protein